MMAIGDFNSIISQNEKFGGKFFAYSSISNGLKNILDINDFIDLKASGLKYTWSNTRQGIHNIREKLDRAVTNLKWNTLFSNASVLNFHWFSSNHSLIILNTSNLGNKRKFFKFEKLWPRDPSCFDTIKRAWSMHIHETLSFIIVKKLNAAKQALKLWNKISFGHI